MPRFAMPCFAALFLAVTPALAADKVPVVASFSILGDLVQQVGGDRVEVITLVGSNGDAHEFEPTPADVKKVAGGKVLVLNGLGFDGWMGRLQQATRFKGTAVIASQGVKEQSRDEEERGRAKKAIDPHAWQSLENGRIYVRNIRDGLTAADPEDRALFEANADKLLSAIDGLEAEVRAGVESIPAERRKIITSHDAFGYFGAAYGLKIIAPQGVSTESEPSSRDVARIIRQIKAEKIPAVFMENITDPRILQQISRESGARIGGKLYSDALSEPDGPAPTYIEMFRYNLRTLKAALVPNS